MSILSVVPARNARRAEIVGRSPALSRALTLLERFAPTPLPVLMVGATGTGKELFAERLHEASGRNGLLVAVNCAALPQDMVESLLFGHAKGAFTGAVEATAGFVAAAERGTLFLDELTSLSLAAQAKFLRVLEAKTLQRLGETTPRPVDVRVVAAAHEDLRARVTTGAFRLDLYERLAGVVLRLPPLRERAEDILPLAEHFAWGQGRSLTATALPVLLAYEWPGNVRELKAAIERAACLGADGPIGAAELAEAIALGGSDLPLAAGTAPRDDRDRLLRVCATQGWDVGRAAAVLRMGRSTLYRRLRMLGISPRRLRWGTERQAPLSQTL